jgi:WD40 repeat protein
LIRKIRVDPLGTAGAVDGCEFSKDGKLVSASDNHGVCRVYRVADGAELGKVTHCLLHNKRHKPDGELNAVPFSYDGRFFCTGRNKDGTKVWRTSDFGLEKHLIDKAETDGIDFAPNGKWLAAGEDGILRIYGLPGFRLIRSLEVGRGSVNSIDFSFDCSLLAYVKSDGHVRVVRTSDWKTIRTFRNRNGASLKSTRFSPDAKYLAYSGGAQSCLVRRVSDWAQVADLPHKGNMKALPGDDHDRDVKVEAVAWSHDGGYLFSSGVVDGVMRVWRRGDWSLVAKVQAQEKSRAIEFIDVSIDNKVVAGGDEGFIYLYQFSPPMQ